MSEAVMEYMDQVIELLIRSGVFTPEALNEAFVLAESSGTSLHHILIINVPEHVINASYVLGEAIAKNEIKLDFGVRAMELVGRQNLGLDTALRKLALANKALAPKETHFLSDILLNSGIVIRKQLDVGIAHSLNTGLTLGMVLVGMNACSISLINAALTAERLIRNKTVPAERAIQALRAARLNSMTLYDSLRAHRFADLKPAFEPVDLFLLSGLISESQYISVKELELADKGTVNSLMVQLGYVNEFVVQAATQLYNSVAEGKMTSADGARILGKMKEVKTQDEVMQVLNNIQPAGSRDRRPVSELEFMQIARLVDRVALNIAVKKAQDTQRPLDKVLVESEVIQPRVLQIVSECKKLLDRGAIEVDQAVMLAVYSIEHDTVPNKAINAFGWAPTILA